LRVDSKAGGNRKTPTPGSGGTTTPSGGGGGGGTSNSQDQHPYARGAVIEVLHQPGAQGATTSGTSNTSTDNSWWSDPDSSEEETDESGTNNHNNDNENAKDSNNNQVTVRLCDIIDRAQNPDGTWRYYIHYRDFNRRMDEWVVDLRRIVSPPSVGNAKARALAAQERALKRQREQQAVLETPRGRRKSAATPSLLPGESEDGRRTRLSRRKSQHLLDDDATVATSHVDSSGYGGGTDDEDMEDVGNNTLANQHGGSHSASGGGGGSTHGGGSTSHKHKEVLVVGDNITTHTVGEHVVATLQAQELDEHEGLDEASLREHEEVTKVKNVAFMELGY
jgi:hypothetical protein